MGAFYSLSAATDSLKVMSYNVLYYGNSCQGPNGNYHEYLRTIVKYANPDLLALVKTASAPVAAGDNFASAPFGFADSILINAMNKAYPCRYNYAVFTNKSHSTNMVLLFYDSTKLGFAKLVSSYSNLIDFNTYKLFYKGASIAAGTDTTFLYLTLNHDKSGDEMMPVRANQIMGEMREIKKHCTKLGNHINLGDFNARGSEEPFYQLLTNPTDTNFRFYDPPFYPDRNLQYPADWDHNATYSAFFTTSTREFDDIPNSCGSAGGAKGWYDHIFLSGWLVRGDNHLKYVPKSYRTLGNDGQRYRIGINNKNVHKNESVPADVLEALYRMSNKYPVMLTLEVNPEMGRPGLKDPEISNVPVFAKDDPIMVTDTVVSKIMIRFPSLMLHQEISVECKDSKGKSMFKKDINVSEELTQLKATMRPGNYTLKIFTDHNVVTELKFIKVESR